MRGDRGRPSPSRRSSTRASSTAAARTRAGTWRRRRPSRSERCSFDVRTRSGSPRSSSPPSTSSTAPPSPTARTADVVDVVRGPEAIRQRFEQLQLAAREEVMAFVKAPTCPREHRREHRGGRGRRARGALPRPARARDAGRRAGAVRPPRTSRRRGRGSAHHGHASDSSSSSSTTSSRSCPWAPRTARSSARSSSVGADSSTRSARCTSPSGARRTEITVSAASHAELALGPLDDLDAQILSLLLVGLNDQAIAYHLGTSLRTVQRRVRHLMDRAGARTRTQLGWKAARLGWSPPTRELA